MSLSISSSLNNVEITKILDQNQENISSKTDWLKLGGNFNDPINNAGCLDLNNFQNNYKNLVQGKKIKEAKEILLNLFKNGYKTIDVEFLLSHIFYLTNDYDNAVLFGAIYL